jgi:crotonobetainyl-CoA:carnitine CoA-transferase CaiB-like acyl-CoA transferase
LPTIRASRTARRARATCRTPVQELTEIIKRRKTEDWLSILDMAGVLAGPVLAIRHMHADL